MNESSNQEQIHPRSQAILNKLNAIAGSKVEDSLLDKALIEEVIAYIEKIDLIWSEGGKIIRDRGYQIRGMQEALHLQGKQIKQVERHMTYYRDHVLPEITQKLKDICIKALTGDVSAYNDICKVTDLIDYKRTPAAARKAVRAMELKSPANQRKLRKLIA